jgi:hypothetical protein
VDVRARTLRVTPARGRKGGRRSIISSHLSTTTTQHNQAGWWDYIPFLGTGPKLNPAYKKITLTSANSPLVVKIAGAIAPAGTTVTSVNIPQQGFGGYTADITNGGQDITLTLVNPGQLPSRWPVVTTYVVTDAAGLKSYGVLGVSGDSSSGGGKPSGPVNTVNGAQLGFPLTIPASQFLAGWTDPDGSDFGIIYAYVRGWAGAVITPTALNNASWSSVAAIRNKRFSEFNYLCFLADVKPSPTGPTARTPPCATGPATVDFRVADSVFNTAKGSGVVSAASTARPVYPHPLFGKDGSLMRKWAAKLGFAVASAPAVTTASATWSNGAAATLSPAASTTSGSTLVFTPPAGSTQYTVTLNYAPAVSYAGVTATLLGNSKGTLFATATITDGTTTYTVDYAIKAPFAVKGAAAYGGSAVFGAGWNVTSLSVTAKELSDGALLSITELDASLTPQPYPQLRSSRRARRSP